MLKIAVGLIFYLYGDSDWGQHKLVNDGVKNINILGVWGQCCVPESTYHISGFTVAWDNEFLYFLNQLELEFLVIWGSILIRTVKWYLNMKYTF